MRALDLFAGCGGWDLACQHLGIDVHGVENMPAAIATRDANGLSTIYRDVWDGLENRTRLLDNDERDERQRALGKLRAGEVLEHYDMLIASPPCQTFSAAGRGAGRRALDDVLALIDAITAAPAIDASVVAQMRAVADDRTALVLTPLAYALRDRPAYIALEQVPSVLPVWEAIADALHAVGYSAATSVLHAEQYGVPQTRRRAILIARLDGRDAEMPTPTHSRYYSRQPERLDLGVEKWVSMAEALGWGMTTRPCVTLGNAAGRGLIGGSGAKQTVVNAMETGDYIDSPSGDGSSYAERTRILAREAAMLQTYPPFVGFPRRSDGSDEITIHDIDYRARDLRPADAPAQTVTEKARSWSVFASDHTRPLAADEAAELQTFPTAAVSGDTSWVYRRPSPTIVGSFAPDVVAAPGYRKPGDPPRQRTPGSVRVTGEQAARLQSFPPADTFTFCGSKTAQFLQIGNAVPPLLAYAILASITD